MKIKSIAAVVVLLLGACAYCADETQTADDSTKNQPHNYIFFFDASQSAGVLLPEVKEELKKAISSLTMGQSFNIVLLREGKPANYSAGLVPATPDSKMGVYRFLDGLKSEGKPTLAPLVDTLTHLPQAEQVYVLVFPGMPNVDASLNRLKDEYHGTAKIDCLLVGDFDKEVAASFLLVTRQFHGALKLVDAKGFEPPTTKP